jgi:hypothetical protein
LEEVFCDVRCEALGLRNRVDLINGYRCHRNTRLWI